MRCTRRRRDGTRRVCPDQRAVTVRSLLIVLLTWSCDSCVEAKSPPTTAQEAALIVRNDNEFHVAMAATTKIIDAWEAVVATDSLQGDIVEVGVYKGGTSMVMAWSLLHLARTKSAEPSRSMWLFDTFEGLPPPTKEDGKRAFDKWNAIKTDPKVNTTQFFSQGRGFIDDAGVKRWNYGPLQLVKQNMRSTGFPQHMLRFVKGKVEDTLVDPANLPQKITVLRLDTDFFTSTKIEMDVLFPRLVSGGVLLVDDYCNWEGSKRAIDEFLARNRHLLRDINTSPRHCFRAVKV